MSLNIDIPCISVTPEAEEDDDHNFLNLIEALTDVEDLYDDEPNIAVSNDHKKLKIKINLDENDGATDLEDFEASDNEVDDKIIVHKKPILIDDLDMETGLYDESYKVQTKNSRGKKKLRTQFSSTKRYENDKKTLFKDDYKTDIENYSTDEDVELSPIPKELDISKYIMETKDQVTISEVNLDKVTSHFEKDQGSNESKHNLSAIFPDTADVTDVEYFSSDSNDEDLKKKVRPRRKRRGNKKIAISDVEDIEISDDEFKSLPISKPKMKYNKDTCLIVRGQSLPIDSDTEENVLFPFPLTKPVATKVSLKIPEFDITALTDTEMVESDNPIDSDTNVSIDDDKVLELIDNESRVDCKVDVTQFNTLQNRKLSVDEAVDLHQDCKTDSDDYESENDLFEEKVETLNDKIQLKFETKIKKDPKKRQVHRQSTLIKRDSDEAVTDLEDVSSNDEDENNLAIAYCDSNFTDIENFSDNEDKLSVTYDDIELPKPVRNLIILKENENSVPCVKITPLDDSDEFNNFSNEYKDTENKETDEEDVEINDDLPDLPSRNTSPDLPILDCGSIDCKELSARDKKSKAGEKIDHLTDTEEYVLEKPKKKPPTFKYIMSRCPPKPNLEVKHNGLSDLTDTEDVYVSDSNQPTTDTLNIETINYEGHTDTELIETDSEKEETGNRALSCTPTHVRELNGEIIFARDGSGPFTETERLNVNKNLLGGASITCSPMYTDTEDVLASGDEDGTYSRAETATPNQIQSVLDQMSNSCVHNTTNNKINCDAPEEVMYLKGGGYNECATDVEQLSEEDDCKHFIEFYHSNEDGKGNCCF